MKVLLVAYAFGEGSKAEGVMSFNLFRALRRHGCCVTVLTAEQIEEANVVSIKTSKVLRRMSKLYVGTPVKVAYYSFIKNALKIAKQIGTGYDIIQHVSPRSLRFHDPLWQVGAPFIWGPVGGSIDLPPAFAALSAREPFIKRLRKLDGVRLRYDPTLRRMLEKSAAIVLTSSAAKHKVPVRYHNKVRIIPEDMPANIEDMATFDIANAQKSPYIFSSGRLVPDKGLEYLILAFRKIAFTTDVDLVITGEGPERSRLESIIMKEGLSSRVRLLGRVSRRDNLGLMGKALFCVYPSLNEAFGAVNIESMAMGMPIICADWGGPAEIVQDGVTGFKVRPESVPKYVSGLAERMAWLLNDGEARKRMGESARKRFRNKFTTAVTARQYVELYKQLVGRSDGIIMDPENWTRG